MDFSIRNSLRNPIFTCSPSRCPTLVGEKLQGSLLKGCFENECVSTCRFFCLSPPDLLIFPHFHGKWETDFYHYWCWRAGGAAPVKTTTGNNFPRKYLRIPRNYYQYWCYILATFLPFSTGTGNFSVSEENLNPTPNPPPRTPTAMESHDSNRTILNRLILNSESPIQRH